MGQDKLFFMAVKDSMTPKQRVYASLSFQEPDRVPRFIWLGNRLAEQLAKQHGCTAVQLDVLLGNDILQSWVSFNGEMARSIDDGSEFTDAFGIVWRRGGAYNSVVKHPLADADEKEIMRYEFPDPDDDSRYKTLDGLIDIYGSDYFIGADVSGLLFEPACYLRGMENVMVDLMEENGEINALLDKLEAFGKAAAVKSAKKNIDWVWLGDDLGAQRGMLISPQVWRKHFKPRMARVIEAVRGVKPGMIIAYHSCGAMAPVIKDLAEIGVNVINPLQESAAGIDQQMIKKEYKKKLTLMCGPDTQTFLLNASPEEVSDETLRLIKTLGEGGGYIFAVSHHIQHDTPPENIKAMFEALE